MIANHIHDALAQVRTLQQKVLDKQRFKGYSGRARAAGGTLAIVGAVVMASAKYPATEWAHFVGWGMVFALTILINYGALMYWFFFDPQVNRDLRRLRPVIDAFAPIAIGGVLTFVFWQHEDYDLLFGTWMCMYGLANLASWHVLPKAIFFLGLYYIICGTTCLFHGSITFLNPWPMGLVFFIGEWAGGFILHYDELTDGITDRALGIIFFQKGD